MITVEHSGMFLVTETPREVLDEQWDRVMVELLKMEDAAEGVTDAAVSVDLSTNLVTIEVRAQGNDFDEATATADRCIHEAIRRAVGVEVVYAQRDRHTELVTA